MNRDVWRQILEVAEGVLGELQNNSSGRAGPGSATARNDAETAMLRLEVSSLRERLRACERLLDTVADSVHHLTSHMYSSRAEAARAPEPAPAPAPAPEPAATPTPSASAATSAAPAEIWIRLPDTIDLGGHWRALDRIVVALQDAGVDENDARRWLDAREWLFTRPRGRFADAGKIIRERLKLSPGFDYVVTLLVVDDVVWSDTWSGTRSVSREGEGSNN